METELRFSALRAKLKTDPYGLLCRFYDFCASSAQDGELGAVNFDAIAERLKFRGTGKRLRSILEDAGYLSAEGYVIGWRETLFRLFTSIREQNRERGRKSGAARRTTATLLPPNEGTEQEDEQEPNMRGENITVTVQRSVERSVQSPLSPSFWPADLPEPLLANSATSLGIDADTARAAYAEFRRAKLAFNDPAPDLKDIGETFIGWVSKSKDGKQFRSARGRAAASLPEPKDWQIFIQNVFQNYELGRKSWKELDLVQQRKISDAMSEKERETDPR